MTAIEYCRSHEPIATYGLCLNEQINIHGIEHEDEAKAYVSHTYGSKRSYHKVKICYNRRGDPVINLPGLRLYLQDFIRIPENTNETEGE